MAFNTVANPFAPGINTTQANCLLQTDGLDGLWYVTANKFTVTSTNVTPTLDNIGGWPCLNLTNSGSTATDVSNFCVPVASILPQPGKRIWIRHTIRMTTTTQDWAFGLGVVGTNIINSDPTDHLMIKKLAANTYPTLRWRKASGTAQTLDLPFTFAADTWYTFMMEIMRDPASAAGVGKVNIYAGTGVVPESGTLPLISGPVAIATQFPDTVKTAPFHAWRAGSAANVSGYSTEFKALMEPPANL